MSHQKLFSESHFGIQLPSGSWVAKNKALEKQLKKERLWLLSKEDSILHFRIRFWPRRPHDVPDPQALLLNFSMNRFFGESFFRCIETFGKNR